MRWTTNTLGGNRVPLHPKTEQNRARVGTDSACARIFRNALTDME